jgi:hypothetical protein
MVGERGRGFISYTLRLSRRSLDLLHTWGDAVPVGLVSTIDRARPGLW